MTTPITGIDSNEFLQSQDIQQIQQQQLLNNKAIRPTLQYGVDNGELTEKDAVSYLQTGSMSQEGQSALSALVQRLNENYNQMMEFFQTNEEVGENEEEISTAEKAKIDMVMSDGICTDEELAEILDEAAAEEEAAEEEEVEEEEPMMEEEGKPWRHDEVVGAFEAFLDDLEAGKDINEMSASDHPGINAADFKRIVSDYKDDQTIGNGAAKDQFEDNTIYNDVVSRLEKDVKSGKLDDRVKVQDSNDNRTYDSGTGDEKSRDNDDSDKDNNRSRRK